MRVIKTGRQCNGYIQQRLQNELMRCCMVKLTAVDYSKFCLIDKCLT